MSMIEEFNDLMLSNYRRIATMGVARATRSSAGYCGDRPVNDRTTYASIRTRWVTGRVTADSTKPTPPSSNAVKSQFSFISLFVPTKLLLFNKL